MDTSHSVLRSARSFLAGTVLSRISGLLREVATAARFGASPAIAAFMVSYRFSNLFRRLLGEGNLQAGFVPHFTSLKEEGAYFFRDTFFSLSLVLLAAVALLEGLLWLARFFVAPDWLEIIDLTAWMGPGLFFICLSSLNSSLLQCRKKYFLPAVAPVIFNLVWIGAVWVVPSVRTLAKVIALAYAGQWLVTSWEGWRLLPGKEWLKPRLFSADFRALLKPLALGIIGVGAVQFNSTLDAIFARLADLKGPAFLWYAIRIQQLPLALFGIALSGALLPPLTRTEDPIRREFLLFSALKVSAALMLAATFGIGAAGGAGVNLLFGHGSFTPEDVKQTLYCLWAYGAGLVPSVFVLLLAARCYAEKNYRSSTIASLLAVALNIALNAFFVFGLGWGAVSVAIATSLSAVLNGALLARRVFTFPFWLFFAKMTTAAAIAALLTKGVEWLWFPHYSRHFSEQAVTFACLSSVYLSGLAAIAWLLRLEEFFAIFRRKKAEPSL